MDFFDLSDGIAPWTWPVLVSSWFGTGLFTPLRAVFALVVALPLAVLVARGGRLMLGLAALVVTGAGGFAAEAWQTSYDLYDDRRIVIDEVAGFLAAALVIGARSWRGLALIAAGFLLLDMLKPWPIDVIEAIPGGLGVMADDVFAGLVFGAVVVAGGAAVAHWRTKRAGDPPG